MLEDLIFNNTCEREIKIGDQNITLRLLDHDDTIEILDIITNIKNAKAQDLAYVLEVLSKSIIKINGVAVNYNNNRKIMPKLDEKVIFKIYQEYEKFKAEISNSITEDSLKN